MPLYKQERHAESTTAVKKLYVELPESCNLCQIKLPYHKSIISLDIFVLSEWCTQQEGSRPLINTRQSKFEDKCAKQTTAFISKIIAKNMFHCSIKKKKHNSKTEETMWLIMMQTSSMHFQITLMYFLLTIHWYLEMLSLFAALLSVFAFINCVCMSMCVHVLWWALS